MPWSLRRRILLTLAPLLLLLAVLGGAALVLLYRVGGRIDAILRLAERASRLRPLPEVLSALLRCQREPLAERCDETTFASEMPVHHATVAAFWMSRTETTVAQYQRCVAAGGRCRAVAFEGGSERFQRPTYPVTQVSFDDATRYCAWVGGTLPSEVQFERAARGASRRIFPWGRAFNGKLANHGRLGVDATDGTDGFVELAPVGSFPDGASPEGLLDLSGNVEEWTSSPFSASHGLPPTAERAVRGGHFAVGLPWLRAAARAAKSPDTREPTLGFRCVWAVQPLRQ
mgnify:CR=1 FL=1